MESIDYFSKETTYVGKNVLVTGATGGIGSQISEALLKCGANVIVVGRNDRKILEKFSIYFFKYYRQVYKEPKF